MLRTDVCLGAQLERRAYGAVDFATHLRMGAVAAKLRQHGESLKRCRASIRVLQQMEPALPRLDVSWAVGKTSTEDGLVAVAAGIRRATSCTRRKRGRGDLLASSPLVSHGSHMSRRGDLLASSSLVSQISHPSRCVDVRIVSEPELTYQWSP